MRCHRSRIGPHRPKLHQSKWLFMPAHPRLTKKRRPRVEKTDHSQQQQNRQAKNQPQQGKENIKKTNHKLTDCRGKAQNSQVEKFNHGLPRCSRIKRMRKHGVDSLRECWICFRKYTRKQGLRILSQNISPLGRPSTTTYFLPKITARSAAGPSAQRMSDVFSQSRASSLVEGFENATPAWPAQAQPCVPLLLCFIGVNSCNPWFLLVTLQASLLASPPS